MNDRLSDTTPEAREMQIEVLRKLGPERRGELAIQWSNLLRETTLQGIRDRNPEYSERRVVLEYARITLGEKLFLEAFGDELAEME